MHFLSLLTLLILASASASAEVLFEAFYRIEKAGKHTGYVVQRVAQNSSNKTLVMYIHTVADGDPYYETFKSVANSATWAPVESVHGGNSQGSHVLTSAYFKGGKAWVETRTHSRKILAKEALEAKRVPLQSSFIFFAADLPKLTTGKNYSFDFYAERAGRAAYGQLSLESGKNGVLHTVLDILGEPQENFVTMNGEPVGARSPADGTIAYWVKTRAEAIGHLEYPSKDLIALFGDLPEGKKNPWYAQTGFDAKSAVNGFQKSFGTRHLAYKEREKITVPMPIRKGSH